MKKSNEKPLKKPGKFFRNLLIFLICFVIAWIAISLIGRIKTDLIIPDFAVLRVSITNPIRLFDRLLSHDSLDDGVKALALDSAYSLLKNAEKSPLIKNRLFRLAARGNLEFALMQNEPKSGNMALAWDLGFFSPALHIIPVFSVFISIPNLYYVQAGKNSRYEYRMGNRTFFIGPYRNLLFISDSPAIFESRSEIVRDNAKKEKTGKYIKPSANDAVILLSPEYINNLLAEQDKNIAAILNNIRLGDTVELGITVSQKKLELQLITQVLSSQVPLSRLMEKRSQAPALADFFPAAVQYATILSAGSLEELYQAALVFSDPSFDATLKKAEIASRILLGITLNDLLFSWSGTEFAVFGMEGRPNPVYAIQITDENKRQQIFNRAFKSIALNENISLNLDGMRIPRIEVPDFLQNLLRKWNLDLPSPYYIIYRDFLLVSESAETLLAALRAMQKNDVLPKTAAWRYISGGKTARSAFSLFYSLDLSVPFFLRNNTNLSSILGVYRQGLLRMNFNNGLTEISLSLVPGSGGGTTLISGYPLDIGGNPSNLIFGNGIGADRHIFLIRSNSAISINPANNTIHELPRMGKESLWIVPAIGLAYNNAAWIASGYGRVTLVNNDMEPEQMFPVLAGIRLSSSPGAWDGKLYLCGEDERIHVMDADGSINTWDSIFPAAIRSPPSFLTIQSKQSQCKYTAVYPKSFFGEIWLLDQEGRVFPNWPAPVSGIGYGSPLLFARSNNVYIAFVTQSGELSIFDENAVLIKPAPLLLDGIFYQQPVYDGEYLWMISSAGVLFRIAFSGEVLQQQIPDLSVKEDGGIQIFDCNGDKVPEIFITGDDNYLHGYTRHFRSLEGFPLVVLGKPLFVDSGNGKKKEIIGIGIDHRLYRWQFK